MSRPKLRAVTATDVELEQLAQRLADLLEERLYERLAPLLATKRTRQRVRLEQDDTRTLTAMGLVRRGRR